MSKTEGIKIMTQVIAHTMQYYGNKVTSSLQLINYEDEWFETYKAVYNECFYDMRSALHRYPLECCPSRIELERQKDNIFILVRDNHFIGSVSLFKNEIDGLIVLKDYRRQGYGRQLLNFAVAQMQKRKIDPICLHVADWNQNALKLYKDYGFHIIKTEILN